MKIEKTTKSKKQNPNGDTEFSNTFFLTFIGELVEIIGTLTDAQKEVSIKIVGYILDVDKEFLYLGDTPEFINRAIKRNKVDLIEIINVEQEFTEILENLEIPQDDSQKN